MRCMSVCRCSYVCTVNLKIIFQHYTVTGNANFCMNQTSLQLLGFTQPQSALPIINNAQNNAKGFTSRILWYFSTPIYSRLADLELSPMESQTIENGEDILGKCFKLTCSCVAALKPAGGVTETLIGGGGSYL